MTWGKVMSLSNELGECFTILQFVPLIQNCWTLPVGTGISLPVWLHPQTYCAKMRGLRTLCKKRGTHWKWSCICVKPGNTFESYPGTFALTSLISANAVERLVPLSSRNLTTQSNTSVLGLSDFEMQRIGIAAAVSFLGGVIQVYMDCKSKSVDVLLVHCTASLIKAMKYCGNLDSEKPIFFESVSTAVSNICSNKVSWTIWPAGIIRKLECRIKGFAFFILATDI